MSKPSKFESPEKQLERAEEEIIMREKLAGFAKEIAGRIREEGVPVAEDCRIDMEAFGNVYPQTVIEKDLRLVKDYEKEWYEGLPPEEIKKKKIESSGEKLEMLKSAIFSKFLGTEFIVARTSPYDDVKNKIDNVILEKETGNLVCALDEVGESSGERYEDKKEKVLERNREQNGGSLKYGFRLEKNKEGQTKIVLGRIDFLPIFYLALPERHIREGIKQFQPSFNEKSDYEEKLFSYFVNSLSSQIDSLKLERHLEPKLKVRLDYFEKTLRQFKNKK